ncbi:MAG: M15 family metallopeptidase [Actinomycetia bacterium]|nr:M15 family metallopeptidase [Actinomycetes bacterium]
MGLRKKQSKFAKMVPLLLDYIHLNGYEVTLGDAYANSGHKNYSLHYCRLAIDLNLFKDGIYLTHTEDHRIFGEFWESIGGSWGGRFNDGNHYSLAHNGRR